MPQVTLEPLVWGDGEVSLELGSETVCRRVRFEGGLYGGLLFTSLLSSFCRGIEITQLQGLHWPNDVKLLNYPLQKIRPLNSLHGDGKNHNSNVKIANQWRQKKCKKEAVAFDFIAAVTQPKHFISFLPSPSRWHNSNNQMLL